MKLATLAPWLVYYGNLHIGPQQRIETNRKRGTYMRWWTQNLASLDWLKGKSAGNHGFSINLFREFHGFPVNFPWNQCSDCGPNQTVEVPFFHRQSHAHRGGETCHGNMREMKKCKGTGGLWITMDRPNDGWFYSEKSINVAIYYYCIL